MSISDECLEKAKEQLEESIKNLSKFLNEENFSEGEYSVEYTKKILKIHYDLSNSYFDLLEE